MVNPTGAAEAGAALGQESDKLKKKRKDVVAGLRGLSRTVHSSESDNDKRDRLLNKKSEDEETRKQKAKTEQAEKVREATDDETKPFTDQEEKQKRDKTQEAVTSIRRAVHSAEDRFSEASEKNSDTVRANKKKMSRALESIESKTGLDITDKFSGKMSERDILVYIKENTDPPLDLTNVGSDRGLAADKKEVVAAIKEYNNAYDALQDIDTEDSSGDKTKERQRRQTVAVQKELRRIMVEYSGRPEEAREAIERIIQKVVLDEAQLRGLDFTDRSDISQIIDDYFLAVPDEGMARPPIEILQRYNITGGDLTELTQVFYDTSQREKLAEMLVLDEIDNGRSPTEAIRIIEGRGYMAGVNLDNLQRKIRQVHLTSAETVAKGDIDTFLMIDPDSGDLIEYAKIYYSNFNQETFQDDLVNLIKIYKKLGPGSPEADEIYELYERMFDQAAKALASDESSLRLDDLIRNIDNVEQILIELGTPQSTIDNMKRRLEIGYQIENLPIIFKNLGYAYANAEIDWDKLGIETNPSNHNFIRLAPDGYLQIAVDEGQLSQEQANEIAKELNKSRKFTREIARTKDVLYESGGNILLGGETIRFQDYEHRMNSALNRAVEELDDEFMTTAERNARRTEFEDQKKQIERKLKATQLERIMGILERFWMKGNESFYAMLKWGSASLPLLTPLVVGGAAATLGVSGTPLIIMFALGGVGGTVVGLDRFQHYKFDQDRFEQMQSIKNSMERTRKVAEEQMRYMSFIHELANQPNIDDMKMQMIMRDMRIDPAKLEQLTTGQGLLEAQEKMADESIQKILELRQKKRNLKNQKDPVLGNAA